MLTVDAYTNTMRMDCNGTDITRPRYADDNFCDCECYVSRTGKSLDSLCNDIKKCVPFDDDDWKWNGYTGSDYRRCGYCDETTTTEAETTKETEDVNTSKANMGMIMIGIVFVVGIFGWM